MKVSFLIPVLLLTLVVLGGGPVADTRGDRQGGTEAELRGLVDELVGAVSAARQNGIEHFITDEFAFIDSTGQAIRKRTFLEELKVGRLRVEKRQTFRLSLQGKRVVMSGLRMISTRRGCERMEEEGGLSSSSPAEQERWALIEQQLLRRAEIVPVLYEVLRVTGIQEPELFGQVADARSRLLNLLHTPPQDGGRKSTVETEAVLRANDAFGSALRRTLKLLKNYPRLLSSEPYLNITDEMYRMERRIAEAACECSVAAGRDAQEIITSEESVILVWVRTSARVANSTANGSRWRLERVTSGAEVGEAKQLAKAGASNITVAQSRRFLGNEEAKLFTRNLPTVDKVELLKLKKNGDLWNGEIESSKMVEGVEAQKTASLWRTQNYLPDSAICHYPGYAIKFYFKDKLIAYATLCWECNNISFETPNLKRTQGFGGRDKKGQQLLQVFHTAFPEAK